ncbi:hypothetical protein [Moraxella lacunata]
MILMWVAGRKLSGLTPKIAHACAVVTWSFICPKKSVKGFWAFNSSLRRS